LTVHTRTAEWQFDLRSGRRRGLPGTPVAHKKNVLRYRWLDPAGELQVFLNFSFEPRDVRVRAAGNILMSTALDREDERVSGSLHLRPDEGVIAKAD
jgi:hypothetical protein